MTFKEYFTEVLTSNHLEGKGYFLQKAFIEVLGEETSLGELLHSNSLIIYDTVLTDKQIDFLKLNNAKVVTRAIEQEELHEGKLRLDRIVLNETKEQQVARTIKEARASREKLDENMGYDFKKLGIKFK